MTSKVEIVKLTGRKIVTIETELRNGFRFCRGRVRRLRKEMR